MAVEIRYATQEDARKFYGKDPLMSFRGVVIAKDDDILSLGGVYREKQNMIAFSEFKPEAFKYKKAIVKAAHMAMEMIQENYTEVYTLLTDDTRMSTSHSFITHYGFVEDPGRPGLYVWRRD